MSIENIKLLNTDILIQPTNEPNKSRFELIEDRQKSSNHFRVIKTSDKVVDVTEGDIIVLNFNDHTPTFLIDNEYYAITSEELVLAVIDT